MEKSKKRKLERGRIKDINLKSYNNDLNVALSALGINLLRVMRVQEKRITTRVDEYFIQDVRFFNTDGHVENVYYAGEGTHFISEATYLIIYSRHPFLKDCFKIDKIMLSADIDEQKFMQVLSDLFE